MSIRICIHNRREDEECLDCTPPAAPQPDPQVLAQSIAKRYVRPFNMENPHVKHEVDWIEAKIRQWRGGK